ncbi:hypothetical protein KBC25_01485 [Candidatus Pacearchaeota archaeon]|nr:hypothetical protein [Candidatus Pacearchaeota archaeon]
MDKRGQVTIFIIIAVLIIAGVALFFVFRPNLSEKEETVTKDYAPLYNYLQDCLEQSLIEVIYINSMQGGYYDVQQDFVVFDSSSEMEGFSIPYYLIDNKLQLLSKEELEKQISVGLVSKFTSCLNSGEFEYNISYNPEEIFASSFITENKIKAELYSSVYINEIENTLQLKNFTAEIETNYLKYYDFAKYLTERQRLLGEELCISCLVKECEAKNYSLYLSPAVSDNSYILINTLNNKEDDLLFSFAYKLNYEN